VFALGLSKARIFNLTEQVAKIYIGYYKVDLCFLGVFAVDLVFPAGQVSGYLSLFFFGRLYI
jgi:hypothetical protein